MAIISNTAESVQRTNKKINIKIIMHTRFYITAIALAIGLFTANAQDKKAGKTGEAEHRFEIAKNLDIFNSIYKQLELFYVDTLDAQKVIRVGIDAMLDELDPYTVYSPEEEMSDLKMMTTGKYGGIGSIIRQRKDKTVMIAEPYENMPAAEVGLKVGDILKQIDDTDLTGKNTSEVSDMLRGEPGTTFVLKIQRPGEDKMREFKVTRRNIKLPAIPYSGMIDSLGYINLSSFTENCSSEVRKAVINLKNQGAKAIVLDLRGNGGGLLQEAVDIVNLFVPKGHEIVSTKGKIKAANSIYKTSSEPLDTDIPLAILVNSGTASAAEIVSGSLQDLDRGVVVGTRTYGKGLVQTPRPLPYNGSLKLTSSKYYIPSGRCIQAIDYKNRREAHSDGRIPDSLTTVFHTAGGREVRDGGGITPDIEVKHDTLPNLLFYLSNDDVLVDYATRYVQTHDAPSSVAQFKLTDADYEEFKKMTIDSGFTYDRFSGKRLEELRKVADFEGYLDDAKEEFAALEKKLEHNLSKELDHFRRDIEKIVSQEIIKRYFYQRGIIEEQLKDDEDLKAAQKILNSPDEYKSILGKK